jgi:hypothetical protein
MAALLALTGQVGRSLAQPVPAAPAAPAALGGATLQVARGEGASDCPDEVELIRRVASHRSVAPGAPPPGASQRQNIDVQLLREDGGYVAHVKVSGSGRGVRTLRSGGDRCEGLAEALAVSLALMLDEEASPERPSLAASSAPLPIASGPASAAPASAPEGPARRREGAGQGSAGGGGRLGLSLRVGGALDAGLVVSSGERLALGLSATWVAPRAVSHPPGAVDVSLWFLTARACARLLGSPGAPSGLLCVLGSAGVLGGDGHGYAPDQQVRRPWFALGGAALVEGRLRGPIGWALEGRALAPLRKETFSVDGVPGLAYDPSPLGAQALGSLTVQIW